MHSLECTRLHFCSKLCTFRFFRYINILRSYNHIHFHVFSESFVDTFEFVTGKFHEFILYHSAVQDVRLSDKVCYKCVLWLVIDVSRRSDLPYVSVVKNNDGIRKSQSLLLVVSHIYECDSEFPVHLLEFDLHVLAHLEIKSGQRLVKKENLRLIHDSTGDGYALLLAS